MADYFTLLRDRVTLKYGSIDRIFLQAYVPKLGFGEQWNRKPVYQAFRSQAAHWKYLT